MTEVRPSTGRHQPLPEYRPRTSVVPAAAARFKPLVGGRLPGLRIINGGGKAEAQAAHIWAMQDGGPDVVGNGIALSATMHWLFDRYLISLTDDYRLLVSHNRVPAELRPLYERQLDGIILPTNRRCYPHPAYVTRHRERYLAS